MVAVAVTLGALLLPGLAIGFLIGLRGWLLAGAAPALTMGFVAAAGLVFGGGTFWAPGPVALLLAALVAAVVVPTVAVRLRRRRPWYAVPAGVPGSDERAVRAPTPTAGTVAELVAGLHERAGPPTGSDDGAVRPEGPAGVRAPEAWRWWHHAGVGVALLVAGTLGARTVFAATDGFAGVNQTWDAFFHFGAVRSIAETGDPSPAALAAVQAPAATDFYLPDAYHCLAALVYRASGAELVPAVNATLAVLPLVLGLGTVALLRVATGRPAHAICGAFLSAVVAVVPYHVIGYGTLIPYATALVLLPGVLALVVAQLRAPGWRTGLALGVAAAGLLHTHPQVAVLAAVIALMLLLSHVSQLSWVMLRALVVAAAAAVLLGAPVLVALSGAVGEAAEIDWPAFTTPAGAVGNLLMFGTVDRAPQWWLAALLAAGLVAVARDVAALRPIVAAGGIVGALYVLAAASDTELSLRLTSLWWNDAPRLAAAFGLLALPVAAVGAVWIRDRIARPGGRGIDRVTAPALLVALLVGFAAITGGAYGDTTRDAIAYGYRSKLVLSDAERDGLREVARIVRTDGGGAVMNDPHDGCGWGYALHGLDMVFRTPLTGPFDWDDFGRDRERLMFGFDRLDTDVIIRADARRLGVRWVALCSGFIRSWQGRAPGLFDVAALPGARKVYDNGAVRLYRLPGIADVGAPLVARRYG